MTRAMLAWRIINRDMDVGTFISFPFALTAMGNPARRLAQIVVVLCQNMAAIDNGSLAEQGTHDYLVGRNGLYARLAALQFGSEGTN